MGIGGEEVGKTEMSGRGEKVAWHKWSEIRAGWGFGSFGPGGVVGQESKTASSGDEAHVRFRSGGSLAWGGNKK